MSMEAPRNPFKDAQRRKLFVTMIQLAQDPQSELYYKGRKRTGASHRCAFWAGYATATEQAKRPLWVTGSDTMAGVCYRAGVEWGRVLSRGVKAALKA